MNFATLSSLGEIITLDLKLKRMHEIQLPNPEDQRKTRDSLSIPYTIPYTSPSAPLETLNARFTNART